MCEIHCPKRQNPGTKGQAYLQCLGISRCDARLSDSPDRSLEATSRQYVRTFTRTCAHASVEGGLWCGCEGT